MYNDLDEMTKDEKSLLLFLETCAVDQGGLVDIRHMNESDGEITENWHNNEFVSFGRLTMDSIKNLSHASAKQYTHWCLLSSKAFELAHQERTARADRIYSKRTWKKLSEI